MNFSVVKFPILTNNFEYAIFRERLSNYLSTNCSATEETLLFLMKLQKTPSLKNYQKISTSRVSECQLHSYEVSGIYIYPSLFMVPNNFEYVAFQRMVMKLFPYKLQRNRRNIVVSNENIEDTLTKTLLEDLHIQSTRRLKTQEYL